jgi:hypothetical protein
MKISVTAPQSAAVAVIPMPILRGLNIIEADRRAVEVMAAVAWEGPALDPDTLQAGDFLAQL